MAEVTPPLYMDVNNTYSGDELGVPWRFACSEGVVKTGDLAVSQRAAGANLSVDVAAGWAAILGDTNVDRQPLYWAFNDAVVNLGISPDPSDPRKVLVVAQATDAGFAGVDRKWQLVAIHGTPAPAPVEPALPASALQLALVDVAAADTSITNAEITDRRVRAEVGKGVALLGAEAWQAYTPTWTGTLGNGTLTGRFVQRGKLVIGHARVVWGSTTTHPASVQKLGLPVAALNTEALSFHGHVLDNSAGEFKVFCRADTASAVSWFTGGEGTAGSTVTDTTPMTWATSDSLRFNFMYEAA